MDLIIILFKNNLNLFRNRAANMTPLERITYFFFVLIVIGFVCIIFATMAKHHGNIVTTLKTETFPAFNAIMSLLFGTTLLLAVVGNASRSVQDIFQRRETTFVLQFPHEFSGYFIYKLASISISSTPVLVIFSPIFALYLIFFHYNASPGVFVGMMTYFTFSITYMLVFCACLSLILAMGIAKLLSMFKVRTISTFFLVIIFSLALIYHPALKNKMDVADKVVRGKQALDLDGISKSSSVFIKHYPPIVAMHGVEYFVTFDAAAFWWRLVYCVFSLASVLVGAYIVTAKMLLGDVGCIADNISTVQNSETSFGYLSVYCGVSHITRGAIYDETSHMMRSMQIYISAIGLFACVIIPYFAGRDEVVKMYPIMFPTVSFMLVFFIYDHLLSDLIVKRSFLHLMRSFSTGLFNLISAKALFHSIFWSIALSVANLSWFYVAGLDAMAYFHHSVLIALLVSAFIYTCYGTGFLAASLFSLNNDKDGVSSINPAVQTMTFLAASLVMAVACYMLLFSYEYPGIYAVLSCVIAFSVVAMKFGANRLNIIDL